MRRYLLTSLTIGGSVALVVLGIYLAGGFDPMQIWLRDAYRSWKLFGSGTVGSVGSVGWLEMIALTSASLGIAWGVVDVSRLSQKVLVIVSITLVTVALSPTLALYGFFFDPIAPLTASLLSAAAALVYSRTEKGGRKRILEEVLGARVSQGVFDELLEAPSLPEFQGMVREASILTCRFLNHADLQEKLDPAELLKMSNLFIRTASTFLISKGGYLDESGPELIRASFGVFGRGVNHAEEACRAALELRARLRNLSQECETRWFQPLQFGVGISSGPLTVGVYGPPQHFFFSGAGTEMEFSRRLALANERYGSDLLIGPSTYRLVQGNVEVRPMELFYDPVSNSMTEIYQLLTRKEAFTDEDRIRRDLFWQGMILMRERNFEGALDCFSRSRLPGSDDPPVAYYIGRAQEGVAAPESRMARLTREFTEEGHARLITLM